MSEAATRIDPELLRRLHSLHQQRDDLEGQLRRGPQQIAVAQRLVDAAQARLDANAQTIREQTMIADDKQLQLSSRESKVANLEAQLNTAASNKEYALLKEQIAAEKKANDCLNDEIFEVLEQIDTLNTEAEQIREEVDQHTAAKNEREQKVEVRLEVVREDLQSVQTKLSDEESKLPAAVTPVYKRLVNALGVDALASSVGNSCEGCNQVLRTQMVELLRIGRFVQCPSCNAILYHDPS